MVADGLDKAMHKKRSLVRARHPQRRAHAAGCAIVAALCEAVADVNRRVRLDSQKGLKGADAKRFVSDVDENVVPAIECAEIDRGSGPRGIHT